VFAGQSNARLTRFNPVLKMTLFEFRRHSHLRASGGLAAAVGRRKMRSLLGFAAAVPAA